MNVPYVVDTHMTFMIEVTDSAKKGISGKYPESVTISYNSDPSLAVQVIMVTSSSDFSISGKDGIMTVPVKFVYLEDDLTVKLQFIIDGITLDSDEIVLT